MDRRRILSVGVVALLAVVAAGLSWLWWPSSSHHPTTAPPPATSSSTTTTGPGSLATVTEQLALVDTSRPLVEGGTTLAPSRSLPTTIIRPATNLRYPLIVFVHGYNSSPATFQRFTTALASEGFVVAAPSFPLEDPTRSNGLDRSDLPNEATDVSFVISSLLASPEAKHLVGGEIGVVGHSDGADVALEVGYQQGLNDPRVRAVVSSAPDPVSAPTIAGGPPLLLIHGSADQIVDPQSAAQVMTVVHAETWSTTFIGADHTSAIIGPSQWTAPYDEAVDIFLTAILVHHSSAGLTAQLSQLPYSQTTYQAGP
jgi:dienelactone hydrolase